MIDITRRVMALLEELIVRGEEIKNTCKKLSFEGNKKGIDPQAYESWKTSCLTLLRSTFGSSSPHYDSFFSVKFFDYYNSTLIYLGILQSAREDVQKGYFYHKDLMLSVNIFTAFLSRAKQYAEKGDITKAVALLEATAFEGLKKLAESRRITLAPSDSLLGHAEQLSGAGALASDIKDRLGEFDRYLRGDTTAAAADFETWDAWLQKFLFENLGSQIVILN